MQRLFVAIRPPESVRNRLTLAMGGISGARWQTDAQLHLTLRFIGEVDRHQSADILAALGGVHHPAFLIAINGIGTFERRGRPETIWAGVTPQEAVRTLHNKIDQALVRIGIAPDQRAFRPHVTLARLNRSAGPVRGLVEQSGGLSSPSFRVDSFGLFESRLTPDGAVYSVIEVYPLD